MPTERFIFTPRGSFSLAQSIRFLEGFSPLSPDGGGGARDILRLAFCVEGDWRPVAISARQDDHGRVRVTATGDADPRRVRSAVERMLSLDVDASPLLAALAGDGVACGLVEELEGLRPVCFASPYEAAAWAVISQRIQMRQAARIRQRMCEELGTVHVEVSGAAFAAFPGPQRLLEAATIPGLPAFKVQRLQAIAQAALDGKLDAATLRAAGPEAALAELVQLPGIGPFGAELVLVRGAGEPDHFARSERRLHSAIAKAYDVDPENVDALEEIASRWSPFRSWVGFLFRARASMVAAA